MQEAEGADDDEDDDGELLDDDEMHDRQEIDEQHSDDAEERHGEGISIGGDDETGVQVEESAIQEAHASKEEQGETSSHARRESGGGQPKEGGPARFSGLFASDSDSD